MESKLKPFGFSTRTPTNCSDNNTFNNLEDYPPINFGPITNDGERGEDTLSQVEYKHETWISDSPVSRAIEKRVFEDTRAPEIEGSTIAKQESKSMPCCWKKKRTARKDGGSRHWGNASTGLLQSAAENSRQEIFYPCTFVWGKVADCPWWPAEVVETEVLPPSLQKKIKSEHTPVKFIGIHKSRSNRSLKAKVLSDDVAGHCDIDELGSSCVDCHLSLLQNPCFSERGFKCSLKNWKYTLIC